MEEMIPSLLTKRRQRGYSATLQTSGASPPLPDCWESLPPSKMPFRIHFSISLSFLQVLKIPSDSKAKKSQMARNQHMRRPPKRKDSNMRCPQLQQDMGLSQTSSMICIDLCLDGSPCEWQIVHNLPEFLN